MTEKTSDTAKRKRKVGIVNKAEKLKRSAGRYYTVFGQRVLPFLLYFIPIVVLIDRACRYAARNLSLSVNENALMIICIIALIGFISVLIISPRTATAIEFLLGFAYLFLAFHYHLYVNALGYTLLIGMIMFLLIKIVFFCFDVIYERNRAKRRMEKLERLKKRRSTT